MSDFANSQRLLRRAEKHLAGGVSTMMRADAKPVPLYIDHGAGSRLFDVDGNEYIDYTLAFGPTILGHSHPAIVEAVCNQVVRGQTYGAQHELEPIVAERICELVPCAEMVVFSTSGTEAVQVALRLARAASGRERFIKFEGHYHGWLDNVLVSYRGSEKELGPRAAPTPVRTGLGQHSRAVEESIILPWNDLAAVERVLSERGGEVAAILTEPVMFNSGGIRPVDGYLEGLRALCDRYGVILIFDEVISGFRVALGGAQAFFGVTPDLAVFGKAVAGGFPLSVVAGRRSILDLVARHEVVHAGTFNGNPVALAAADATLRQLATDSDSLYPRLHGLADRLRDGLLGAARASEIDAVADGVGPAFTLSFAHRGPIRDYRDWLAVDGPMYGRFAEGLVEAGVLCLQRGMWYLSAAHTDSDVDVTLGRAQEVLTSQRERAALASVQPR